MTDCSRQTLSFSSFGPKAVVADFRGGRLTTDAGALLLRELERRLGLFEALDACIPDPRQPELIEHDQKGLLAQRITALALGYEDLNDHQTLRDDPALQLVAGRDPTEAKPLASPPTLCRLENRVDRQALGRIAAVLVDQFIAAHPEPPEALILDFDATDDLVHGHQERRSFHGYYDHHCSLPLYVFCGDELLVAYLRPSNIDAAKPSRAILRLLVRRLRGGLARDQDHTPGR
jgi:Transposase DDE domain group 1